MLRCLPPPRPVSYEPWIPIWDASRSKTPARTKPWACSLGSRRFAELSGGPVWTCTQRARRCDKKRWHLCCQPHRPVLLCSWSFVSAQLHFQVQSDHCRGEEAPFTPRMPQCFPPRRYFEKGKIQERRTLLARKIRQTGTQFACRKKKSSKCHTLDFLGRRGSTTFGQRFRLHL